MLVSFSLLFIKHNPFHFFKITVLNAKKQHLLQSKFHCVGTAKYQKMFESEYLFDWKPIKCGSKLTFNHNDLPTNTCNAINLNTYNS